ncbi:DUF3291 domain-containing protein [Cognatitamlana onchidii]|uniref:DUF3291 domain-containing protein n=1 Tax=Cognatitamlana onchidii TaxID=2562860 RepID=UPI0010A5F97B|nr:DUF3291 domain-containing protein [Algibacter onchidii]
MDYHLAQVNIAKRKASLDDPIMVDFVNNVNKINGIADQSDGFIWRMKDEDKDLGIEIFHDDSIIINISVWKDLGSLFNYTYKSGHIDVFKRKKEWFINTKKAHMAFWYVPAGYRPNFQDAKNRLDYLDEHGESPYAFSFKSKFSPEDALTYNPLI